MRKDLNRNIYFIKYNQKKKNKYLDDNFEISENFRENENLFEKEKNIHNEYFSRLNNDRFVVR